MRRKCGAACGEWLRYIALCSMATFVCFLHCEVWDVGLPRYLVGNR